MVTVIVPVYNLTGERYRNFWFIFCRLCAEGLPLIVIEQCHKRPRLAFPSGVKHIVYRSSADKIEKSKLINEAVKHVETEYVWVNDADVWTKYSQAIKFLQEHPETDALKPFRHFVKLDPESSDLFINEGKVGVGSSKQEKIGDYGAGSFIIRKSIIEASPMSEEFVGWGFEDIEWGRKIAHEYDIAICNCVGAHLYHDQPKVNRSRNEKVYKRMRDEVHIFHALNIVDFKEGSRMHEEQERTKKHIIEAKKQCNDRVHIIASCDPRDNINLSEEWNYHELERTADQFIEGCDKNFAYLRDLMDMACESASDRDDWVMFTNSDCFPTVNFYKEILNSVSDVILFHRDDLDSDNSKRIFEIGVDGIAVRKSIWEKVRDDMDDYLIGVPHWDTYAWYYFVKNSKYDVVDNLGGLRHYKHERTWDFYNPDAAGQYNKDLFFDYIGRGKAEMLPMKFENEGNTALIMAVWGDDANRVMSTRKVLSKLSEQYLNFTLFFVELLFEEEQSSYEGYVDGEHIIIRGKDRNRDIFQKEALWNIGAERAKDFDYYIFCDCDIWSEDPFWLYKIRNKMTHDQRTVVQGANLSIDTMDDSMNFQTLLAKKLLVSSGNRHNPGLIYGMTREYFEDIGGFNPLFLVSCGDSGFINEVFKSRNYESFLRRFPFFRHILRDVREAQPEVVDVDIIHEHHGKWDTRNYVNVDLALNAFRKDLRELIRLDENGIVEWIDPNCPERSICQEKKNMKNREEVVQIFTKCGVDYLPKRIIFNHVPFCSYNIVEEYLGDFFKVYHIGNDGRDIESGISYDKIEHDGTFVLSGNNIFRPDLFTPNKDDFYFTFIRHPLSLFIADYSFLHNVKNAIEMPPGFVQNHGNTYDQKKIELSPKKYVDWFIDENDSARFAYMPYYLGLESHHFIGFVERVDWSIMSLCQHLFLKYDEKSVYHEDEIFMFSKKYRQAELEHIFSLQISKYENVLRYYDA